MKHKYLIIILFFILIIPSLQAITWSKVYCTINEDYAQTIKQTPDSGYIVIGSGIYPDNKVWLIKMDKNGDSLWSKTINNVSGRTDIEIDYDSGFIISINYGSGGNYDLKILKTDPSGNYVWSKLYNFNYSMRDYPFDLDKTSDSCYIVVGNAQYGNDNTFILKLAQNGDSLWYTSTVGENYFTGVCENSEKGFITTITGDPHYNISLYKYDSLGNYIGSVWYNNEYYRDIEMLNDLNYIVITNSDIFKVDENLDTLWSLNKGSKDVEPCLDGGFVIVYQDNSDGYLQKYNINGDSLWASSFGGSGDDGFNSVSRTYDGGYICCGYTDSWGAGGYDFYIVKTDSLGYALGVEEELNEQPIGQTEIIVNNISSGFVSISFVLENDGYLSLSIYDLTGRIIETPVNRYFQKGVQNFILSDYQSGVYFYSIENEDMKYQGKFQIF